MKIKEGNKVKIIGKIPYGQDFSFWVGEFKNAVFTISKFSSLEFYKLIGSGYGMKENYGNGAIYVSKRYSNQFNLVKDGYYEETRNYTYY